MVTLPTNTMISVRIANEINSSRNHTGDLFTGIVDPSVMVHDRVVIPRGTEAHVRMAENKKGGHLHGKAKVSLELVSLVVNGRRLVVYTDVEGKDKGAIAAKMKAETKEGMSGSGGGGGSGVVGPAIGESMPQPKAGNGGRNADVEVRGIVARTAGSGTRWYRIPSSQT